MSERQVGKGRRGLPVVQPVEYAEGWGAPPPPGERRDAAEHRRRILATARELFAQRGVDAVSMHEIARAVGVGQGTLYRRYGHKGELCAALLEEGIRRFQGEALERLRAGAAATPPEPALAQLDYFLARLAAFNEENTPLLGAMADAAGARRGLFYHSPMYGWMRQTVAALLRRAVAEGETPALDLDVLPDLILAPLAIDLYGHLRRDRGLSPEQLTAALRRLLFDGLRGARPGADEDRRPEADAPRPS